MQYSFAISNKNACYEVSVDNAQLGVKPLPPFIFDLETYDVLANSLKAIGQAFLSRQYITEQTRHELMRYYVIAGYQVADLPVKESSALTS